MATSSSRSCRRSSNGAIATSSSTPSGSRPRASCAASTHRRAATRSCRSTIACSALRATISPATRPCAGREQGLSAWSARSRPRGTPGVGTPLERGCRAPAPDRDGRALLRNLVVREGRRTGLIQVRLVTTEGELEVDSLADTLAGALGDHLSAVLWTRSSASPRPPPAASPSASGASASCPRDWVSSTCASPRKRSSKRTPRWPRSCIG